MDCRLKRVPHRRHPPASGKSTRSRCYPRMMKEGQSGAGAGAQQCSSILLRTTKARGAGVRGTEATSGEAEPQRAAIMFDHLLQLAHLDLGGDWFYLGSLIFTSIDAAASPLNRPYRSLRVRSSTPQASAPSPHQTLVEASQDGLLNCAQPSICSGISTSSSASMQMPTSKPISVMLSHTIGIALRASRFHCANTDKARQGENYRKGVHTARRVQRAPIGYCSRSPCSCCRQRLRRAHLTSLSAAPASRCNRAASSAWPLAAGDLSRSAWPARESPLQHAQPHIRGRREQQQRQLRNRAAPFSPLIDGATLQYSSSSATAGVA